MRKLTLYRDDSTVQVVYERVKAVFWTAGNTMLVISQWTGDGNEHRYIHWPRERFCWFKDETVSLRDREFEVGYEQAIREVLADLRAWGQIGVRNMVYDKYVDRALATDVARRKQGHPDRCPNCGKTYQQCCDSARDNGSDLMDDCCGACGHTGRPKQPTAT